MSRITLMSGSAAALLSLAFSTGCNSAQFSEAPLTDSGPPCSSISPTISCVVGDGGDEASTLAADPTACVADPTSSDSTVARIPSGVYPVGCTVQFTFTGFGGECSLARNPCTCLPTDAGPDAAAPGQWSSCADADISYEP